MKRKCIYNHVINFIKILISLELSMIFQMYDFKIMCWMIVYDFFFFLEIDSLWFLDLPNKVRIQFSMETYL